MKTPRLPNRLNAYFLFVLIGLFASPVVLFGQTKEEPEKSTLDKKDAGTDPYADRDDAKLVDSESKSLQFTTSSLTTSTISISKGYARYKDVDGDGFGDINEIVYVAYDSYVPGYSMSNDDCDDSDPDVHPRSLVQETDKDCNCDGIISAVLYSDDDRDGYGNLVINGNFSYTVGYEINPPAGTCFVGGDCDDSNPNIYPGAEDLSGDNVDGDCDGMDDAAKDNDGDGYSSLVDCRDNDPFSYPGAYELCDGVDNDCDGGIDMVDGFSKCIYAYVLDADGDGFPSLDKVYTYMPPSGQTYLRYKSGMRGDCNDENPKIFPGQKERKNNRVDENCDGVYLYIFFEDADGDGYGNFDERIVRKLKGYQILGRAYTTAPVGYVYRAGDCNDNDPDVNPGAEEVGDRVDNDCDGTIDEGTEVERNSR